MNDKELEARIRTLEIRLEEVEKVVHDYEVWRKVGRAIRLPKELEKSKP